MASISQTAAKTLRCWLAVGVVVGLAGLACAQAGVAPPVAASGVNPTADPVVEHGLRHTTDGQSNAASAIKAANTLLASAQTPYRLYAAWETRPKLEVPSPIPVYLVEAPATTLGKPAAVPVGCTCVFVNPASLNAWLAKQTTGAGRLQLESPKVLAFMFLHEVGHISKNSTGMEFENDELSELNVDVSTAKLQEQDADEFAAQIIRDAMNKKKPIEPSMEASWISIALTELSWNMQAHRSLDEFGSTALGTPSVFFDPNLSHPNLDWRILHCNYLIQGTPEAKALLDSFEEARAHGANQRPLYSRDPAS